MRHATRNPRGRTLLALALVGALTVCTDASNVTLLEVDAEGVVFGQVYLDSNSNEILDAQDTPLRNVTLELTSGRGVVVADAETDTLGLFTMLSIPVGSYRLALQSESLGDSVEVYATDGESLTISRGDTTRVNFGTSFPRLTVEEVLTAEPGKRIFTTGIALNSRIPFGDGRVHIKGEFGYLRAIGVVRSAINTGDSVRIVGRTATSLGRPVLEDVTPFLLVGQAEIPVPVETETGTAAAADGGSLDAALVRVRSAEILDTTTVDGDFHFTIDDGTGPLKVVFQSFLQTNTSTIRPDTVIRVQAVSGLLVPHREATGGTTWRLLPRAPAELTLGVKAVDLAIATSVDDRVGVAGDTVNVEIVLSNIGGLAATAIEVVDSLPAGLALLSSSATRGTYSSATGRWTVGDIMPNESDTLRLRGRITSGFLGTLTNVARIAPLVSEADVNPGNNIASVGVTVVSQIFAEVEVEVTADRSSAQVGDTINFTVLTINNGPFRATDLRIRDSLPSTLAFVSASPSRGGYEPATGTWTIDTLHAGVSQQLRLKAQVLSGSGLTSVLEATLQPLLAETDTVPGNNSDTAAIVLNSAQQSPMPLEWEGTDSFEATDPQSGSAVSMAILSSDAMSTARTSASSSVAQSGTITRTSASSVLRFSAASLSRSILTRYSLWATRPRPWYQ